MPKTINELIEQFYSTSNPVTKWSLRLCIMDRIYDNHS